VLQDRSLCSRQDFFFLPQWEKNRLFLREAQNVVKEELNSKTRELLNLLISYFPCFRI
jgi:hypothetical protein